MKDFVRGQWAKSGRALAAARVIIPMSGQVRHVASVVGATRFGSKASCRAVAVV